MKANWKQRRNSVAIVEAIFDERVRDYFGWYRPCEVAEATGLTLQQVSNAVGYVEREYGAFETAPGPGRGGRTRNRANFRLVQDGLLRWLDFARSYNPHDLFPCERAAG